MSYSHTKPNEWLDAVLDGTDPNLAQATGVATLAAMSSLFSAWFESSPNEPEPSELTRLLVNRGANASKDKSAAAAALHGSLKVLPIDSPAMLTALRRVTRWLFGKRVDGAPDSPIPSMDMERTNISALAALDAVVVAYTYAAMGATHDDARISELHNIWNWFLTRENTLIPIPVRREPLVDQWRGVARRVTDAAYASKRGVGWGARAHIRRVKGDEDHFVGTLEWQAIQGRGGRVVVLCDFLRERDENNVVVRTRFTAGSSRTVSPVAHGVVLERLLQRQLTELFERSCARVLSDISPSVDNEWWDSQILPSSELVST